MPVLVAAPQGARTRWVRRFLLSLVGFVICAGILAMLLVERFARRRLGDGRRSSRAIAALCIYIRNHYRETKQRDPFGG